MLENVVGMSRKTKKKKMNKQNGTVVSICIDIIVTAVKALKHLVRANQKKFKYTRNETMDQPLL